jgi:hypothetical protein
MRKWKREKMSRGSLSVTFLKKNGDDGLIEYECGRVGIDGSWEVLSSMKAAGSSYSKGVNSSSFLFWCILLRQFMMA